MFDDFRVRTVLDVPAHLALPIGFEAAAPLTNVRPDLARAFVDPKRIKSWLTLTLVIATAVRVADPLQIVAFC